jgi:hypothetical protein
MTGEEKLDLVTSGEAGVPRLGIPPLAFIDGPNGVGHATAHVTAFPSQDCGICAQSNGPVATGVPSACESEGLASAPSMIRTCDLPIRRLMH